ncbi:MAG TPA: glycosyltransferase family 39 protein [Acidobacteriaceae bacterium]|jgi:4-amino-4-deoxy-L-arabinose transferase-like glycosyltransferase|nr:glycosyltransferase family 39 protein [Acidobacteriaceae bacterium]
MNARVSIHSSPHPVEPATPSASRAQAWMIFWIALFIRVAYMTLAHTWHIRPYQGQFAFGYEMGRIARALATGYGFADPFHGHTGPTAWVPPLYPWILAGVFKLTGVYTALSAWIILAVDCVLNALMIPLIWEIAQRCFNRKVALWSAWLWALYPAAMQYAVRWIWEMTLTTLLFVAVLAVALRMRHIGEPKDADKPPPSAKAWALFGLLWGLIALSDPSLCLFLPVCGLWILLGVPLRAVWPRQILSATLAALVFIGCLAPWTVRNFRVFHRVIPLRANFGVELYLGNGPGATGLLMEYDHPFQAPDQFRLYSQMGEIAYSQWRGALAKQVIAADPAHFAVLCVKRFYYFWFSVPHPGDEGFLNEYGRNLNYQFTSLVGLFGLALALRRRMPAAGLFAWAFVLLPLTYYFVTVHARFRHPLEPLITILAVYLFQSAEKSWQIRWFRRKTS